MLGALAMIDDGELDWKVIAINEKDPLFAELNDAEDVEKKLPGVVSGRYRNTNRSVRTHCDRASHIPSIREY